VLGVIRGVAVDDQQCVDVALEQAEIGEYRVNQRQQQISHAIDCFVAHGVAVVTMDTEAQLERQAAHRRAAAVQKGVKRRQ
jgi:hypothetical protein